MTTCGHYEELNDYAFDELEPESRRSLEQHIAACPECASQLVQLRLTTAALRALPDVEAPQRIAFISDKVFAPSPVARWFSSFWNSAARLGFASACVLAIAIVVFSANRHPAAPPPQTADYTSQINDAVKKAVAAVRDEDAHTTRALLEAADRKHQQEHRALMVAVQENLTLLQKRYSTFSMLASADRAGTGGGQ